MTITVFQANGTQIQVVNVASINVANNVLFLYDGNDAILAGFANGVWQRFVKSAVANV